MTNRVVMMQHPEEYVEYAELESGWDASTDIEPARTTARQVGNRDSGSEVPHDSEAVRVLNEPGGLRGDAGEIVLANIESAVEEAALPGQVHRKDRGQDDLEGGERILGQDQAYV